MEKQGRGCWDGGDLQLNREEGKKWSQKWNLGEEVGREKAAGSWWWESGKYLGVKVVNLDKKPQVGFGLVPFSRGKWPKIVGVGGEKLNGKGKLKAQKAAKKVKKKIIMVTIIM